MIVLLAILAFAAEACAQKTPDSLQKSIDEHSLTRWGSLRKTFHIDERMPDCAGSCSAERITVPEPRQEILRICQNPSMVQLYLRFLPEGANGWRFAGSYIANGKNIESRHRIIRFGTKPFLIVTAESETEDDASSEFEAWMDLTRPGLKPVFRFTTAGHSAGPFSIAVQVSGSLAKLDGEGIHIARSIQFSFGEFRSSRSDTTVYRSKPDGGFVLDGAASSIAARDVSRLYESLPVTNETFLHYDIDNLKKIASGPDSADKRWLGEFILKCEDTPETIQLKALLPHDK